MECELAGKSQRKRRARMIINVHFEISTVQENWHQLVRRLFFLMLVLAHVGRLDQLWTVILAPSVHQVEPSL